MGCQRTVDEPDDLAEVDAVHGPGQRITAELAAFALHETRLAHLEQNLHEEFLGQLFLFDELADAQQRAAQFLGDAEINQRPERVFTSFG